MTSRFCLPFSFAINSRLSLSLSLSLLFSLKLHPLPLLLPCLHSFVIPVADKELLLSARTFSPASAAQLFGDHFFPPSLLLRLWLQLGRQQIEQNSHRKDPSQATFGHLATASESTQLGPSPAQRQPRTYAWRRERDYVLTTLCRTLPQPRYFLPAARHAYTNTRKQ